MNFQNAELFKYFASGHLILSSALTAFMLLSPSLLMPAESFASTDTISQSEDIESHTSPHNKLQIQTEEINQHSIESIHHNQKRIARPGISNDADHKVSGEEVKRTSAKSFALSGRTDVFQEGVQNGNGLSSQTEDAGLWTLRVAFLRAHAHDDANLKLLKSWVSTNHAEAFAMFARLPEGAIVNVLGHADHEEQNENLRKLGLSFVNMTQHEIETADFSNARVVILNCNGPSPSPKDNLRLSRFIGNGGCLIETDWAATDWLCVHFPSQFKALECLSGPIIAKVNLNAPNITPQLTRGIAREGLWLMEPGLSWCEYSSVLSDVTPIPLAEGTVSVRETCPTGAFKYYEKHIVPAFYFKYGKGMVLHLAGHYEPNFSDAVPSMGISVREALLLNFLIFSLESQDSHPNFSSLGKV